MSIWEIAWNAACILLNAWALTTVPEGRMHTAEVAQLFRDYGHPNFAQAFVIVTEGFILLSCYAVTSGILSLALCPVVAMIGR